MTRNRRAVAAALVAAVLVGAALALRPRDPGPGPAGGRNPAGSPAGRSPGGALFGEGGGGGPGPAAPPAAAAEGPWIRGAVVDGKGSPVAGAEVAAARDGDRAPVRATSDREGRFALSAGEDPDAERLVGARAPGFAPTLVGGVRPGGPDLRILLRPGVRLRGSVRDGSGSPCPGARVRASLRFPGVAKGLGGLEAVADEEGRYSFPGIPPVEGTIEATFRGASSGESPFDFPPGAAEAVVDLLVRSGPAIEGLVRGAGAGPLEGIQVAACEAGGKNTVWAETGKDGRYRVTGSRGGPVEVVVSDPKGQWQEARFPGVVPPREGMDATLERNPVAPGSYSFRVVDGEGKPAGILRVVELDADSGSPAGSTYLGPGEKGPDAESCYGPRRARAGRYRLLVRGPGGVAASGDFSVEGGALTVVGTLRLAPGAALRGRLLGPDGLPASGALLFACADLLPDRAAPGPDGRFAVESLPPGTGVLRVLRPRCEVLEAPWTAGPGAEADLGDLRMRAATGAIRGVVRTGSGTPVEGAAVRLSPGGSLAAPSLEREARAGPDGRFEIQEVPAGRWRIAASPPSTDAAASGFSAGRTTPPFVLAEGGTREVEIRLE